MSVTRFPFDKTKIPYPTKPLGNPLSQKDIERLLGVSAMTVYLWRKNPTDPFPCRTIPTLGGNVRLFFPEAGVIDWLKRNRPAKYNQVVKQGASHGTDPSTRGTVGYSTEGAAA